LATALETGIDWGTKIEASIVTYHFAEEGGVYDGVTAYDWFDYEILQVERAFALFETFLDLTFLEVASGQYLTLVLGDRDDMGQTLGFFYPPGEPNAGLGAFNWQGAGWDYTAPGTGALEQGGYGFITIIHELGHALGLAHPHDTGGASTIFPGVTSAFDDYGDFDLNQGVYTTMSYNRGWDINPSGVPPATSAYGYQGTPMALDIAVLQANYGPNLTHRTGADTYVLPTSNAVGTFYSCLWDAGGIDAIVHDGLAPAVIDLRPATLQVEPGGGGFLSYVDSVFGGFTIANGVVIENARGGSGGDTIFGNAAGNVLEGRGGNDVIEGLGGADTVNGGAGADTMRGGTGGDTYVVDNAGDIVDEGTVGSGGIDLVRSSVSFNLADSVHAIGSIENLTLTGAGAIDGTGNTLANLLAGNGADNVLDGGGGGDTMRGGAGHDTYIVDNAGDVVDESIAGSSGIDLVRSSVGFSLADGVQGRGAIENLTLTGAGAIDGTGNALANTLVGNTGANILRGGLGQDVLDGRRGRDSLIGGEDGDAFMFSVRPKRANADHFVDFLPGDDAIRLDHDIFAKLGLGELKRKWFHAARNANEATDNKDRIVYDTESGKLRYDKDGKDGHKAKLFAILDDSPDYLSHHDILIVA
jgi:serralysin